VKLSEVHLTEESEDNLKREALDKIMLAMIVDYIESSTAPERVLDRIHQRARKLVIGRERSDDSEISEYANRYAQGVVDAYFEQFRIERS